MSWAKSVEIFVLLLAFIAGAWTSEVYKDFKVYDIYVDSEQQLGELQKMAKENKNYDFLYMARRSTEISKILISPSLDDKLRNVLIASSLNFTLITNDVSEILAKERRNNVRDTPPDYPLNVFEGYYRHDEINEHMEVLAKMYPSRVFVKTFGRSYENRPLKVITIINGDERNDKKIVFIDAAMHAREWIAPAMALHIMHELTENFEQNKVLLAEFDWVIMPVVNADGYEYTHDEYRYWRKTRRPSDLEQDCYGTDPNRNFDFVWGWTEGASPDPCDETYHGEKAFSEPETQVVRDIMHHYGERLVWYLTLHSYGNYILLPWGHTSELPGNYFEMMDVADAGAMAIVLSTNGIYTYGNTYNVMYPTSGDSADYAVAALNVPISMCMELPAGGFLGFDPPVRQIEGIVTETWIGVRAMAEVVTEKY